MLHAPVAVFAVLIALSSTMSQALAGQSLMPTPYPGNVGGAPLNPEPSGRGAPQELMHDPYPAVTGPESQGNPPVTRAHRLQRPVPTINERKYRVDRQ